MILEHIIEAQSDLLGALRKFAAGELDSAAMKPFGAPFGIYQQRDGKFMNRIRLTGGENSRRKRSGSCADSSTGAARSSSMSRPGRTSSSTV